MLPKTIEDYGGPFVDAKPVSNPTSQVSAARFNRLAEDGAELTRTGIRAIVHFIPVTVGDPTVAYHTSVWGSSSTERPTITRGGTGLYTIEYAASFTDPLGVVESVSLVSAMTGIVSDNNDRVTVADVSSNQAVVKVWDNTGTLSDLTGAETVMVWFR